MGIILGAHGVRGAVKVKSFATHAPDIAAMGALETEMGERRFHLHHVKAASAGIIIARIDGVEDRVSAQALKGVHLYVERDRLPAITEANTYYAADLLGLSAVDASGAELGRIGNVADYGAGTLLEIEGGPNGDFAVPFVSAFVPSVDLEAGCVTLDLPVDFFSLPDRDSSEEEAS